MGEDSATVPSHRKMKKKEKKKGKEIHQSSGTSGVEISKWKNTFYESSDTLLVFQSLGLLDQVDLVLQDDNIFQLHDLHCG